MEWASRGVRECVWGGGGIWLNHREPHELVRKSKSSTQRLLVDPLDEDSWYLSALFQPAMRLFWQHHVNSAIPLGHDPSWLRLLPANTFQRWIRSAQRTDAKPEIDDINMGASLRGCGGTDSEKMMDLCAGQEVQP